MFKLIFILRSHPTTEVVGFLAFFIKKNIIWSPNATINTSLVIQKIYEFLTKEHKWLFKYQPNINLANYLHKSMENTSQSFKRTTNGSVLSNTKCTS